MNYAISGETRRPGLQERNLDLFTFAIRCIADGDTRQLKQMGLAERDIVQLQRLSLAELIDLSDRGLDLQTYFHTIGHKSYHHKLSTALIEQRAPRELMTQLFRMSTRRYSAERMRLGIAGGRGRPTTTLIDSTIEHRLWRLWVLFGAAADPRRLRAADHWLLISYEVPGHLRSAWSLIQRWAREPEALSAFTGDRARRMPEDVGSEEQALRQKHRSATELALIKA